MIRPTKNISFKRKMKQANLYLSSVSFLFMTISCTGDKTGKMSDEPTPEVNELQHEHHDIISVSEEQFSALDLHLGSVEVREIGAFLKATGYLKVPPKNKAHISSLVNGTVTDISVHEGEFVKKGQVIAEMTSNDFIALQQELLEVRSQLIFAESDLKRKKTLAEHEVAAKKQLEEVQREYDILKAKEGALSNQIKNLGVEPESVSASGITGRLSLRSPINGNVAHIEISIGSRVQPSAEIMHVIDNSQLHLDLFLFEKDLPKVKVGQTVDLVLTNMDDKPFTARVFGIGSAFEGSSKTIPVHATITGDKEGLIEGMNVTARVNVTTESHLAVPSAAIINSGDDEYIFIVVNDHAHSGDGHHHDDQQHAKEVKMVQVRSGTSNDLYTHITPSEEISAGTQVVTSGGFYLLSMFRGEEREHAH
jgi:RND family efflux transporter MFP subunit